MARRRRDRRVRVSGVDLCEAEAQTEPAGEIILTYFKVIRMYCENQTEKN